MRLQGWLALLGFLAAALGGCSPAGAAPATAVRAVPATTPRITPPLAPPLPTLTQTRPVQASPTALPMVTVPVPATAAATRFCCLRFATAVDAPPQTAFVGGTEEIVALWDYAGMAPGDRVRRIWFRDDLIWLTREETWDWDKYGAAGTVTDIAIYDNEGDGLLPARYRLQLYVNDLLAQEAGFVIDAP